MTQNVMSLSACDELARLVGHRRFEIETFELVLDTRVVQLTNASVTWAPARMKTGMGSSGGRVGVRVYCR